MEEKLVEHRLGWFGPPEDPEAPINNGILKGRENTRRGKGLPKLTFFRAYTMERCILGQVVDTMSFGRHPRPLHPVKKKETRLSPTSSCYDDRVGNKGN
jgi:hypothetical protein